MGTMNNFDYQPIIEQFEESDNMEDKQRCIFTMVRLMATNHLHAIEKKQQCFDKKLKKLFWLGAAILVSVLLTNQMSIEALAGLAHVLKIF